jgi:hypothetical protein
MIVLDTLYWSLKTMGEGRQDSWQVCGAYGNWSDWQAKALGQTNLFLGPVSEKKGNSCGYLTARCPSAVHVNENSNRPSR